MEFVSRYVAKTPDSRGYIEYTAEENQIWHLLYSRQLKLIQGRACDAFVQGLDILQLDAEHIPQLPEVTARLHQLTQWKITPVEAIISARAFF